MNFDVKEDDNNDDGEIYTKPKMSAPIGKTFVDTKSLVSLRLEAYKTAMFDNVGSITYDHFFNNYLIPNIPCIFTNRVTESWKSRKLWRDVNNSPAFEYLRSEFGNYHSFTHFSPSKLVLMYFVARCWMSPMLLLYIIYLLTGQYTLLISNKPAVQTDFSSVLLVLQRYPGIYVNF